MHLPRSSMKLDIYEWFDDKCINKSHKPYQDRL